jgi:DNA mismatch repair protein MutS
MNNIMDEYGYQQNQNIIEETGVRINTNNREDNPIGIPQEFIEAGVDEEKDQLNVQYFKLEKYYQEKYPETEIILMIQNGKFFEIYGKTLSNNNTVSIDELEDGSLKTYIDYVGGNFSPKKCKYIDENNCEYTVCIGGRPDYIKDVENLINLECTCIIYFQKSDENNPEKKIRRKRKIFSTGITPLFNFNKPSEITFEEKKFGCISFYPHRKINKNNTIKISFSCISFRTNEVFASEIIIDDYTIKDSWNNLINTLYEYRCQELLIFKPDNLELKKLNDYIPYLKNGPKIFVFDIPFNIRGLLNKMKNIIRDVYKNNINNISFFKEYPDSIGIYHSIGELFNRVNEQNPDLLNHIKQPKSITFSEKMELGNQPHIQLNILPSGIFTEMTKRSGKSERMKSVLTLNDNHITSMGKRMFKNLISRPIINSQILKQRYNYIELCIPIYEKMRSKLRGIIDISAFHTKLCQTNQLTFINIYEYYNQVNKIINIANEFRDYINENNYLIPEWFNYNELINYCELINIEFRNKLSVNIDDNDNNNDNDDNNDNNDNDNIYNIIDDDIYVKCLNNRDYLASIETVSEYKNDINFIHTYLCEAIQKIEGKKMKNNTIKKLVTNNGENEFIFTDARYKKFNKDIKNDRHPTNIKLPSDISFNKNNIKPKPNSNQKKKNKSMIYIFPDEYIETVNTSKQIIENCRQEVLESFKNLFIETNPTPIINFISNLDVWCNQCLLLNKGYCIPNINENSEDSYIKMDDVTHPIMKEIVAYTPNSIDFNTNDKRGILLYGVNESGKSSFMKSIGMNIYLAQCGFVVSCKNMEYSPYEKLFTRIQSQDNIWEGNSTYRIEVEDLFHICRRANNKSFILADEPCHGTETSSAIELVLSIIELLNEEHSQYLFTTHLHELKEHPIVYNSLNGGGLRLFNIPIEYNKENNEIRYPRKLQEGVGLRKYGIMVAKVHNIPDKLSIILDKIQNDNRVNNIRTNRTRECRYNSEININRCSICGATDNLEVDHSIEQQYANEYGYVEDNNGRRFNKNIPVNLNVLCKKCHNDKTNNEIDAIIIDTSNGQRVEYIQANNEKTRRTQIIMEYVQSHPDMGERELINNFKNDYPNIKAPNKKRIRICKNKIMKLELD